MKIGIIGNPNVGKTTIFNYLTGLNQKVGNWPGVTVEKKEGVFTYNGIEFKIIDLPGIYELDNSLEAKIAIDAMIDEVEGIIYIGDSTKIGRSLYLLLHILQLGKPVSLILNYKDFAAKQGIEVDIESLSRILNINILQINARDEKNLEFIQDFIYNSFVSKTSHITKNSVLSHLETFVDKEKLSKLGINEFYSILFLKDVVTPKTEFIYQKVKENINYLKNIIEKNTGKTSYEIISETIYSISYSIEKEVIKKHIPIEDRLAISNNIDKVVTNKYFGIPIFAFIMYIMFFLVFEIGNPISGLFKSFFETIGVFIDGKDINPVLKSFLSSGIINGIGSVLVLLPNIVLMFLFMSILEDSGYLARAAFVMDSFMHRFNLHGKSFIPMFLGFGCNVPAIMATRIIESRVDRLITILITPFMSCSARLPVYIMFTGIFFKEKQGLVVFSLYFIGIIVAIISANIFKRIFKDEERFGFIMELPLYQIPQIKKLILHMWERALIYIKKAGSIIFLSSIIIWALSSFPFNVEYASEDTYIARIGKVISFIFIPAGFGFWQASVSLIFGIFAKETVVSTMTNFFGGIDDVSHRLQLYFSPLSAYSFLIMTLLYMPCIATISVIKAEAGTRWAIFSLFYTLFVGWLLSTIIYQVGKILN
ncbi:MAG TPA: ferrous iron transport protein B [Spirochaetota bacterium]|nr:ferrous iron transport protein B [Spirochaetota bacterium]HOM38285.1 ferrous iron transport protein B [Spirochaetota bacterium]HPQ48497.1 ferrous iron transport protein B [Spirochaetota bacterium]